MIPLVQGVMNIASKLMIKRPAAKLSLGELATRLEESGKVLERRYGAALDTAANREKLRHVIGIERWGLRRMETFTGKAPVTDESDAYLPSPSASWRDLKLAFVNTRRSLVALARQLDKANLGDDRRAAHNQQGDLTAREWLYYLRVHADFESRRIK
jgi:hypothetical protein